MEGLMTLSIGARFAELVVESLRGMPPWLIVLLIAMLPIVELRGAIPVALFTLGMSWPEAVVVAILGNLLPVPFILWLLGPMSRLLSRWEFFDRFFRWLFARTLRKSRTVERYEALGLVLFVGIPLPITGAYTGSVAAYLFGIPFWRSMLFITIGVCLSATVVTLATMGVISAAGLFTA